VTLPIAGRYALEREIGRGATATVYIAHDRETGRKVAVKMLRQELVGSIQTARFVREIELTGALDHARILPVLDSGIVDDRVYFVLPYMEGGTLRARLQNNPQLPLKEAIQIWRAVAEALAYAHEAGFVHRDVKPENILFDHGEARLADFGIARALERAIGDTSTSTGVVRGTAAYMSPEQASATRDFDGRSDLFSLGCVVYEMLAGVPAFIGPSPGAILAQRLLHPPRDLRVYRPSVPRAVNSLVMKCLEVLPADRIESAADLVVAIDRLGNALDSDGRVEAIARRRRKITLVTLSVLVVGGAISLASMERQAQRTEVVEDNLIAVAPFDVYDTRYAVWHEGLLDVLSSCLDGAGRLRTVSPAVVVRKWHGPGQRSSGIELARATHARYAIVGRLLSAGPDSIRATAVIIDARTGREVSVVEARDTPDRVDRLADSISVRAVRELGESTDHRTRTASLGAASLPALKAYLQGEYYLRRTQWDSAGDAYAQALAFDSSFALANWRMKTAVWSKSWGPDTAGDEYALRAGRLNHGLAPRESLLIVVDSIWASLALSEQNSWSRIRRISTALDEAAREYPGDPWVWYKIGEARFHLPIGLDHPLAEHLAAFDRAIALDSGFALAYVSHAVELALILDGPDHARRYARGYHIAALPGVEDSAGTLTEQLLDSTTARSRSTILALDRASADVLYRVTANLGMWFDDGETAIETARRLYRATNGSARFLDGETKRLRLAHVLSVRGRFDEAWAFMRSGVALATPSDETIELVGDLAMTGVVPERTVDSVFGLWMTTSPRGVVFALPWWAQRGDTAAIERASRKFGAWMLEPDHRDLGTYGSLASRAYLAMARHDTTRALRAFAALSDSLCADCYLDWFTYGRLLLVSAQWTLARRQFERVTNYAWILPTYPAASLWLGRVADRMQDFALARHAYTSTETAWVHGDSAVRPFVQEAISALQRRDER
jgi:serine/threonine-protein kinase